MTSSGEHNDGTGRQSLGQTLELQGGRDRSFPMPLAPVHRSMRSRVGPTNKSWSKDITYSGETVLFGKHDFNLVFKLESFDGNRYIRTLSKIVIS
jgi:hypothetical protein